MKIDDEYEMEFMGVLKGDQQMFVDSIIIIVG